MTLNNMAAVATGRGRFAEAERLLTSALETLQAAVPADHPDVGLLSVNLGEVYRAMKDYERATPLYTKGLRILESAWGAEDPRLIPKLERYSELLRAQEQYAEAETVQVRQMRIRVKQALRP
jgi:tetratricopeptide (TPR) repeat protein